MDGRGSHREQRYCRMSRDEALWAGHTDDLQAAAFMFCLSTYDPNLVAKWYNIDGILDVACVSRT